MYCFLCGYSELITEDALLEWIESQEELAAFVKSPKFESSDPLAGTKQLFLSIPLSVRDNQ
jgi:hypothetical protein